MRAGAADAAVLTLAPDGGGASIATAIDGNGRRVACDPYTGAVEAVLECAANLACVGAEPLGLTNCLNFGNPEKPHVAWQLSEAVRGIADACGAVRAPVVGGNVSLYNEGGGGPIYPTPVVGMVGRLDDPAAVPEMGFRQVGDGIALAGPFRPSLAGSELEKLRGGLSDGLPPVELTEQAAALAAIRGAAPSLSSVHDISAGGSRWRSPNARLPAASAPSSSCRAVRSKRCSARAPEASSSRDRRRRSSGLPEPCRSSESAS